MDLRNRGTQIMERNIYFKNVFLITNQQEVKNLRNATSFVTTNHTLVGFVKGSLPRLKGLIWYQSKAEATTLVDSLSSIIIVNYRPKIEDCLVP